MYVSKEQLYSSSTNGKKVPAGIATQDSLLHQTRVPDDTTVVHSEIGQSMVLPTPIEYDAGCWIVQFKVAHLNHQGH